MRAAPRIRPLCTAVAIVLAALPTVSGSAVGAPRGHPAAWSSGVCPTSAGVTVVVDFQQLGGGRVVRCARGPVVPGFTGLDALRGAGLHPVGTKRYGLAFVCRVAGRPAPHEQIPIHGNRHYREACVDTPSAAAFWSYWYARNRGTWTESAVGAGSRDAIPGGFEGWSFSLNHTQDSAPPPGVPPRRS